MNAPRFCECECGEMTKMITKNDSAAGRVKGEYPRFIKGHFFRAFKFPRPTHGQSGKMTPVYRAYINARQRCRSNHPSHEDYFDRGIKFLFNSFEQWFTELGHRPADECQVDRINNNGNYEPGNVRWATKFVQMSNRNVLGVYQISNGKWRARYAPKTGEDVHLGYFTTKKEALAARSAARKGL